MASSKAGPAEGSLASLASDAVSADPELQSEVRRAVRKLVSQVEFTLQYGSSNDKIALMKAALPAMMKSLGVVDREQGERDSAAAYSALRTALGGDG